LARERAVTWRWSPARSAARSSPDQRNNPQSEPGQQIIVRTQSGVLVAVTQPLGPDLQVGQRVYLQGSGEDTRVIPR
jgi:outer membrane lipoprotein SlyB